MGRWQKWWHEDAAISLFALMQILLGLVNLDARPGGIGYFIATTLPVLNPEVQAGVLIAAGLLIWIARFTSFDLDRFYELP